MSTTKALIFILLCSCSYGIKEQRELAAYSHRAKKAYKDEIVNFSIHIKESKLREEAKECMKAASAGIFFIQHLQENKLNKKSTSLDESDAIISYKRAKNKCQQF